jgi:hypothetical protein
LASRTATAPDDSGATSTRSPLVPLRLALRHAPTSMQLPLLPLWLDVRQTPASTQAP